MNVYIIKAIEPKKKKRRQNESKAEHQVLTEESF